MKRLEEEADLFFEITDSFSVRGPSSLSSSAARPRSPRSKSPSSLRGRPARSPPSASEQAKRVERLYLAGQEKEARRRERAKALAQADLLYSETALARQNEARRRRNRKLGLDETVLPSNASRSSSPRAVPSRSGGGAPRARSRGAHRSDGRSVSPRAGARRSNSGAKRRPQPLSSSGGDAKAKGARDGDDADKGVRGSIVEDPNELLGQLLVGSDPDDGSPTDVMTGADAVDAKEPEAETNDKAPPYDSRNQSSTAATEAIATTDKEAPVDADTGHEAETVPATGADIGAAAAREADKATDFAAVVESVDADAHQDATSGSSSHLVAGEEGEQQVRIPEAPPREEEKEKEWLALLSIAIRDESRQLLNESIVEGRRLGSVHPTFIQASQLHTALSERFVSLSEGVEKKDATAITQALHAIRTSGLGGFEKDQVASAEALLKVLVDSAAPEEAESSAEEVKEQQPGESPAVEEGRDIGGAAEKNENKGKDEEGRGSEEGVGGGKDEEREPTVDEKEQEPEPEQSGDMGAAADDSSSHSQQPGGAASSSTQITYM